MYIGLLQYDGRPHFVVWEESLTGCEGWNACLDEAKYLEIMKKKLMKIVIFLLLGAEENVQKNLSPSHLQQNCENLKDFDHHHHYCHPLHHHQGMCQLLTTTGRNFVQSIRL